MRRVRRHLALRPEYLDSEAVKSELNKIRRHYDLQEGFRHRRRLDIDRSLFYAAPIHSALSRVFSNKCAFCEILVSDQSSEIEHFRPIGNAANIYHPFSIADSPDHYAWFAFEWDNLYLACTTCISHKKNYFPVASERAEILSSWQQANKIEEETLLDPCLDNPRLHLRMLYDGSIEPLTQRGSITCEILGLNRLNLVELRAYKINTCFDFFSNLNHALRVKDSHAVEEIQEELTRAFSYKSEFVGLTAIFFADHFEALARSVGINVKLSRKLLDGIYKLFSLLSDAVDIRIDYRQPHRYVDSEPTAYVSSAGNFSHSHEDKSFQKQHQLSHFIDKVEILNFKGIQNLSFDFSAERSSGLTPSLTLLGENATGKSSVLQAISMCLMGKDTLEKMNLNATEFVYSNFFEETGISEYKGKQETHVKVWLTDSSVHELKINLQTMQFETTRESKATVMGYSARRFFDENDHKDHSDSVRTLFNPLATISNPIPWLLNSEDYEFNTVARVISQIFTLEQDEILDKKNGKLFIYNGDVYTPINRLSEGYKSLFAMTVDICRNLLPLWNAIEVAKGVVLIDEIETHLHPRWKLKIMTALRRAFPNVQFIVTTHDPLCLRGMQNGEVQVLYRDDNYVIEKLNDLPDIKGMRADQLLTSDFFGLSSTADPEFESQINQFAFLAGETDNKLNADNKNQLLNLERLLADRLVVGDSPAERVAYEAFNRYIDERNSSTTLERAELQEDAVKKVVEFLNTQLKE